MSRAIDKLISLFLAIAVLSLLWKLYRKEAKQAAPDNAPSSEWIARIDKQNEAKWNELQENKPVKEALNRIKVKP